MITYSWSFPQFYVAKSEDNFKNVVKVIHWRYTAQDGEYLASAYGTVNLGAPNPTSFISYDKITEKWAIDVVTESLDVSKLKNNLAKQIENQKNPPVEQMAPPFSQ